ncbi:type II/IV secretion system ATPase subunit [Candidatus Aciduliprofundum boonei]|uniref:Type II secretion system protein E n=1 Tax=Aciduliprofundum boonei (strain DSM 19572 / T469) TaxID=439481 RepID=D3TB83_ACIB4|nr:type II/IV secretion system ATPase subunit [Candidatus Aciduliprofundum boonei]ADD07818.1 type II secretion system protein E [Aciduliprofundum boonei T469]HII54482.1 type II/IV secretion system ATPase subunit [Candidatus Aciduliprofundum boonei]
MMPKGIKKLNFSIFQGIVKPQVKIKIPKFEVGRSSDITPIPPLEKENYETVEVYPVYPPYVYTRIIYDREEYEYIYDLIEPPLTDEEQRLLDEINDTLDRTLKYEWEIMTNKDREQYLRESVDSFLRSRDIKIDKISKERILYYVVRDHVGYQKIEGLIRDEYIEDISCDGVGVPIYVFHKKYQSIKTKLVYKDDDELNSFIVYISQKCGKQISVAEPILDGTTAEGHRVQATYGREVTTRGGTFTIRRFKEKPFTPTELVLFGTASPEIVAYLWLMVEHGESAIVIGGPACGKTSTLNAFSMFIPPTAKIVSIEDTREINLPHQNWIPGTTRSGIGEASITGKSAGEIDMYDLVRAALRQRPNYIIVGEVRGKETYTMFQAMATGHTTYSTMHADSIVSMIHRLENPPINCPRILMTALNNVIIQKIVRTKEGITRRITQLVENVGFEPETNELITNVVFEWDQARDTHKFKGHSYLFDKIMTMKNMTHNEMMEEFERRVDIVKYWVKKEILDFRDIWKTIANYYKDPIGTAEEARLKLGEVKS